MWVSLGRGWYAVILRSWLEGTAEGHKLPGNNVVTSHELVVLMVAWGTRSLLDFYFHSITNSPDQEQGWVGREKREKSKGKVQNDTRWG